MALETAIRTTPIRVDVLESAVLFHSTHPNSRMQRWESPRETARETVRCKPCGLVQFQTRSGRCRRCLRDMELTQVPLGSASQAPNSVMPPAGADRYTKRQSSEQRNHSSRLKSAVARRSRAARERIGMTQTQLARQMAIPRSYLSRIENERLLPGPKMLERLASALRIDFASLWTDGDEYAAGTHAGPNHQVLELFLALPPARMRRVVQTAQRMVLSLNVSRSERLQVVA